MINPIALSIGPFDIHWYGIAYTCSLFLGLFYGYFLHKKNHLNLTKKALDDIMIYFVIGIVVGGRLGHVVFYEYHYFIAHPLEIFQTWRGGMSFHGGVIGAIIAMYVLSKRHNINFFSAMDFLVLTTPIGIFLGRLANFINGELYGKITDLPWALSFPGVHGLRHPTQIYEALLEGLVLFITLNFLWFKQNLQQKPGVASSYFLILYGALRFPIEFLKDVPTVYSFWTHGHLLNAIMIITGALLLKLRQRHAT